PPGSLPVVSVSRKSSFMNYEDTGLNVFCHSGMQLQLHPSLFTILTMNRNTVSAVVSVYNEAGRVEGVLEALLASRRFEEIIVVDDGSTDNTQQSVEQYPVQYIRHPENLGKGRAMDAGVQAAHGDIIFFTDADVTGFTPEVIDRILKPVLTGVSDMHIGMTYRRIYAFRFLFYIIPLLSGVRALKRTVWEQVPASYKEHFKIETALNFYARRFGRGYSFAVIEELGQVVKENKYGLLRGALLRIKMDVNIVATMIELLVRESLFVSRKERAKVQEPVQLD
ncbi:MAG: glycosyltransferase family 2 protein, partial [Acidobacteriota bacterium]